MSKAIITIEVMRAGVDRQLLQAVEVPAGSTVQQALLLSGVRNEFPELDLANCPVGIFGKVVSRERALEQGDRIEIYRPLLADPKEVRRLRAAKAAKARQASER
ncbi:RnfH family protein [Pseudomonas syringae group sp. J309-1]|uniref:RnfH family protein n=1 Tax=Pseudomonas syringae group sp. J309-1 TaxID=3079588 RepID=UPI002908CBEF|nr:RnfH family protein [Pseudomonas syringae group sp. J309-1]MDU8359267.1 RnfH family protein [Pseudomonas syringae group sp. J309-1]